MDHSEVKTYAALPPMDESGIDANSSYAHLLSLVDGPKRVVDFGCGPGNLSRFLAQRGCSVVGVDINPDHAGVAREYCEDVLLADLDTVSLRDLFPVQRFDVAIFADILEHLRNPEHLLAETARILAPGGYVIASIPNIAHGAVRLALLDGEFDYQPLGVLDDTHIRFFTRKSMESFFEKAGFVLDRVTRTVAPIFDPSGTLVPPVNPATVPDSVLEKLRSDPDSETLQFIVRAVPAESMPRANAKRRVATLERRVQDLETQLVLAQAELAERLDAPTRAHLDEMTAELQAVTAQADEVRFELEAARIELARAEERTERQQEEARKHKNEHAKLSAEFQQLASMLEIAGAERLKLETLLSNANEALEFERARAEQRDKQTVHLQEILRHQVEQVNSISAEGEALKRELESLRGALAEKDDLYESAAAEVQMQRAQIREATLRAERAEFYLDAMRKSKFWKVRNMWFAVKQKFGVTTDIP
jgi:2-polyprenyl-3-methyl-5-hydroxy-6-metoxy-1,4-benzoquinol methylase